MERFLIIDVDLDVDVTKTLTEKFELTVLDAQSMTADLLAWQGWKNLKSHSTIIVLPGNGASIVKKYIDKADSSWLRQWPWKFYPHAKRVWAPGENPQTFAERIAPTKMLLGIQNVVVVDDVISSGSTIQHLRKNNEPWIPKANWVAATWVMQNSASTKGFSEILAIKKAGTSKRAPINSLSTLLECPEIAKSYAQRNFGQQAKFFMKIMENLK